MMEASEAHKIQATCYEHAADLIEGAERLLAPPRKPHLSYHLALLALEEIGKAGLVASRAAVGLVREEAGMEKWLGSHPEAPLGSVDAVRRD
jgi:AbiV family abortive infection protein